METLKIKQKLVEDLIVETNDEIKGYEAWNRNFQAKLAKDYCSNFKHCASELYKVNLMREYYLVLLDWLVNLDKEPNEKFIQHLLLSTNDWFNKIMNVRVRHSSNPLDVLQQQFDRECEKDMMRVYVGLLRRIDRNNETEFINQLNFKPGIIF